jgi:anti-sigma factor RsiW
VTHDDAWPLLEPWLDSALGADQRWAVAAHVASCPADRVRANVGQVTPAPAYRRRLTLVLPAVAAFALLLAGVWLVARATDDPDRQEVHLVGDLAASHDLFARDESMLEVDGGPDAVENWFVGKVRFPAEAPDVPGYRLAGARLITVGGRPASMVLYEDESEQRYVSLVTFDAQTADVDELTQSGAFLTGVSGETAVAVWSDGGLRHALIMIAPQDEALRLAAAVSGKS